MGGVALHGRIGGGVEERRGDRKRKREMREVSERERESREGGKPEQRNGFWSFHGTSGAGAEEGAKGIRTVGNGQEE